MTTIAWDGKTLAADKRVSFGTHIRTVTKIFKVGDCLIATSGDSDVGAQTEAWFRNGADPEKFPAQQRDNDNYAPLLVIRADGILRYDRTPYPLKIEDEHYAMGSGAQYAITAMHLGKTAREAVEIAALFDSATGNGIDELKP